MAVKTFTSGEVLTASDTNTYLNNGGLVYITGGTSSGANAFTVSNCFTSAYTNYQLVVDLTGSATSEIHIQLTISGTATAAGYGYGVHYTAFASLTDGYSNSGNVASALLMYCDAAVTRTQFVAEIYQPFTTNQKGFTTNGHGRQLAGYGSGRLASNTAHDGFKLFQVAAGNIAATYWLYGRRQA